MQINMQIWILTFRVYGGLKGKKCLKNKPKITDFLPSSIKFNLVALYSANTSPMAIINKNDENWNVCMCCSLLWFLVCSARIG